MFFFKIYSIPMSVSTWWAPCDYCSNCFIFACYTLMYTVVFYIIDTIICACTFYCFWYLMCYMCVCYVFVNIWSVFWFLWFLRYQGTYVTHCSMGSIHVWLYMNKASFMATIFKFQPCIFSIACTLWPICKHSIVKELFSDIVVVGEYS